MVSSTSCNKANISTLCTTAPNTGAQISLLCLSLFFLSLSTYNKTICTPIPPLFLSNPMSHIGKKRLKKKRRRKRRQKDTRRVKMPVSSEDKRKKKDMNPIKRTGKSLANRK